MTARGPVLGTFDHRFCLDTVSYNVEAELGYRPPELLGLAIPDLVHPDDRDRFRGLVTRAVDDQVGSRSPLRFRHGDGRWRPVRVGVVHLAAERPRFGLSVSCDAAPSHAQRLAHLERRLFRIGQEIAAAGVPLVTSPELPPELDQLPEKQREVLVRLLEGERVPGIAKRMFLSPSTVRNHLSALFRRYGVSCQEELLEHFQARRAVIARVGRTGEDQQPSVRGPDDEGPRTA